MQLPWINILIFTLFVIGLFFAMQARKPRTQQKCKHCGSLKMIQISHETLDTRTVDRSGAGGFLPGNDIRLQVEQNVTYHCEVCNKKSTFRVTRTS